MPQLLGEPLTKKDKKKVLASLTPKIKKDKNKKRLKQINKAITRVEKQVTKLHQIVQKLQALKIAYQENKAA